MIVIVSGPINAGKSTVARQLSRLVPDSLYIDGDNLAPIDLPNVQKWATAVELISQATLSIAQTGLHLFVSYPIDAANWEKIKSPLRTAGYDVRCVVLAPPFEVALSERSGRQLSDWERARISVMYDEGYDNPSFANLVIDNSGEGTNETAQRICDYLQLDGRGLN